MRLAATQADKLKNPKSGNKRVMSFHPNTAKETLISAHICRHDIKTVAKKK